MRVVVCAIAFTLIATTARADDALRNERCASSYESAQLLMKSRKLIDASRELETCLASCPGNLVRDCEKWIDEQRRCIASVELEVHDASGAPLAAEQVEVDGRSLGAGKSLRNFAVDPGVHVFRVTVLGRGAREVTVTLAQGEKSRNVSIVFASRIDVAIAPSAPPVVPKAPRERRIPAAAYVLTGVAIASAIVGGALVIHGIAKRADLASTCGANGGCDASDLDKVRAEWLWGGIALGVGGTSLGAAAIVFAVTPQNPPQAAQAIAKVPAPYGLWVSGSW